MGAVVGTHFGTVQRRTPGTSSVTCRHSNGASKMHLSIRSVHQFRATGFPPHCRCKMVREIPGPRSRIPRPLIAAVAPMLFIFAGCAATASPTAPGTDAGGAPPLHESESVVALDTSRGRAAAELVARPAEIAPSGRVVLQVQNRGEVRLVYGRPISVERWDGQRWVETDESRNAAWTMEALLVEPRGGGVEQRWPFLEGHVPQPGWYRFTKSVGPDIVATDREQFVVRARVRVSGN